MRILIATHDEAIGGFYSMLAKAHKHIVVRPVNGDYSTARLHPR